MHLDDSTDHRNDTAPPTEKEREAVFMLKGMMGDTVQEDVVLGLLRFHNGDADKAASALLEGNFHGVHALPNSNTATTSGPRTPPPSKPEKPPVIDLTGDDDDKELSRALQASLEESQVTNFGPSTRAPDPNWAMVSSNTDTNANTQVSQEHQMLSRAIEESLAFYSNNEEVFEELPLEKQVRKGGRPVALRPTSQSLTYASLLLHGLFFVPQVRLAIAEWRPPAPTPAIDGSVPEVAPPKSGPGYILWSMLEIFANMDLAQLSELNVDAAIAAFGPDHWNSPVERPGDVSFLFYNKLAWIVEAELYSAAATEIQQAAWPRLFHFRYGSSDADLIDAPFDRRIDLSAVKVDIRGTDDANDLLSCLSSELTMQGIDGFVKQQVIIQPSDVVAFQLVRDNLIPTPSGPAGSRVERQTFRYPMQVYLDQFLKENLEIANARRARLHEIQAEVESLHKRKDVLTRHNDRDVLADMYSSIYYYENIAEHENDPQRETTIQDTARKLRKIVTRIENELQTIDVTIAKLGAETENIFDCPELRKHRYDLRVVLAHDGLYGRNHLYSYVKQKGRWWKTVDYLVTEVSEDTVLNDPVGLHLGAGPYFLIYSRALGEEEDNMCAPWPEVVKANVRHNNKVFLEQLPPEIAAQVTELNSSPGSPDTSAVQSEYTISSDSVEPPESRQEPMEVGNQPSSHGA
ncbi:hypothetical protein CERSUDRAFT_65841 [Gelatoporia subvermispora B]|uniref:Peptidase C19 ubiquitin carboxyl-terminal hydrolase domain-containing protein n=1 Tax=Ceriporiopsis subvermispora (strain B) TaxID=914234 RepID=M2RE83_CERS8|nr:hypothetical protein CERSUDRAFT_65841 [Gelatoporia subvermispora B]